MTLSAGDKPVLDVLPVGMQDCALVLKDEDGNDVTELEEFPNVSDSNSNLTPAAINIENSSDVIIGPVTQFHGPVTIYQNVAANGVPPSIAENGAATDHVNGKLVKSESTSSDTPPQTSEKSKKVFTYSKHLKYIGLFVLILLVVVVVATVAILSLTHEDGKPPHGEPTKGPGPTKTPINHDGRTTATPDDGDADGDDTLRPAGPGAIVEKTKWGGRPALHWNTSLALKHPTTFVIIMHTVTPQCDDFDKCSKRVQSIQSFHVSTGLSPDIRYNFLVGGDGNAYVGRGWDVRNSEKADSIAISFIGNYVYDYLNPEMINVTKKLLDIGVRKGKLAEDYKLVAHNQTHATESPGAHVYEVIKDWPHFDPRRFI